MENIKNAIKTLNPWWAKKKILEENIIERSILKDIIKTLKAKQIKDILGVRRSGKTTILYLLIDHLIKKEKANPKKIVFLSFDEINIGTADFEDIEKAIYQINPDPEYLFIDEIQEKKNWEKWVKQLYDQNKFKQIIVSGSNASILSKDIGKLLSGRHITIKVHPFSFKEYLKANGWKNFRKEFIELEKNKVQHYLMQYLKKGGFPETIKKDDELISRILINTYNDIISRDIASRHNVDPDKIDLLTKYLFTNITKEYSYNSLAKAIEINIETVEKYLAYLKESFLALNLNVFSFKLKTQYKQNKKIYAIDLGLRNSIAFRFSEDIGKLYENAVFLKLKREGKEIYYWKNKSEVDFVVKEGIAVKELIQVSKNIKNKKTKEREIKGLIEAAKEFKQKEAKIITEDTEKEELIQNIKIKYIPLWKWLLVNEQKEKDYKYLKQREIK